MRPRQRAERPESELPSIGAVLAGWRLVRRLPGGAAERADFVAVCEAGAPGPAAASRHWQGFGAAVPEPLVHRRLAVAVGAAADGLVRECEARERLVGDFVERPEELLDDGGVRLALFEVRPVRGYAAIVADGGSLPAGACVTLLVPVAETVALAHGRGLAHGDLGLGVCGVDGRGRPRVDGWSTAVELEAVSAMRADLARAADLRGLGRVADALLAQSSEPPAPQLAAIVAALLEGTAPRDAPGRLIDALFAWCPAEPVPVAVLGALAGEQATAGADGGTGAAAVARRAEAPERGLGLLDDEPDDESEADRPGPRRGAAERRRERALEWRLRATALAGGVRPRLWLAASATGAVIAVAALLLGAVAGEGGGAAAEVAPPPTSSATAGVGYGTGGPASDEGAAAVTAPPQDAPDGGAPGDAAPDDGASDDDALGAALGALPGTALGAAPLLAALRDDCLAAGDDACLRRLFAAEAPGLAADLDALAVGGAAERRIVADEWVLAADLGDIEIVQSVDGAGSVSVERTAAGWRLRDVWLLPR